MTDKRWLTDTQKEAWQGLLAVAHRAMPELERDFKTHDMLGVHYHIFITLSASPNRTLRLSELANSANLSQSRLTHRLRHLIERGDITVREDPTDRRAKNATLTKAGQDRLAKIAPGHAEKVLQLIFDPLNETQTTALADALSVIAARLSEHPKYLNP